MDFSQGEVNNTIPMQQPPTHHSQLWNGLSTGLSLRPARPKDTGTYEKDRVAVSRYHHGKDEKERAKFREISTKGITPKLSCGSVKNLLTSDDKEYDISKNAVNWKMSIENIWQHSVAYNFAAIFLIPNTFDIETGVVPPDATFTNAIKDHDKLGMAIILDWQVFVWASEVVRRS